ncbi:MAG TPA: carboxypeptidase-like regulatory domain-containing protein, partial [Longimicrobium sp.]|nr:carboxypeptidase-like regulatory domain-containing protein [Longimicrobium sp.]
MNRIIRIRLHLLLLAPLAPPALLSAQTVQGRVTEAGSERAVPGAIVLLVDSAGARAGATLSDPEGEYRLTARTGGTYRLRVVRVGYAASAFAPVQLRAGETVDLPLRVESTRIVLEPVVVTGNARSCAGDLNDGAQAATLWDEARKALLSTTLAAEAGRYRFVTETRELETSADGRTVRRDEVEYDTLDAPFEARSAGALVSRGYVELTRRQVVVYGVDAAAILSDEFLQHHCFGLRDGGEERLGLVGLEFVPLRSRRYPDVSGVLWIDRASAELRFVEYGYTGLEFRGPVERLTGQLHFRQLPEGTWITEQWTLVVPVLRRIGSSPYHTMRAYRIRGLMERTGRVLAVQR